MSNRVHQPYRGMKSVSLTDLDDIPETDALYVGTPGTVAFWGFDRDGKTPTLHTMRLIAGYHSLRATRVMQTGTTASDIFACYR